MEYVRGRSLENVIDAGRLGAVATAEIGLHVLGALQAAHDAGVLHRDVKPSNIIVSDDGKVFLVDFGIAHITDADSITTGRVLLGTIEYLAPERLAGAPAGPAADLWSLGVTFYYALTGRSPFRRGGDRAAAATMRAIMSDPPPPLGARGPLADAVLRLLDKEPARRMTAHVLEETLRPISAAGSTPSPSPGQPPPEHTTMPSGDGSTPPQRDDQRDVRQSEHLVPSRSHDTEAPNQPGLLRRQVPPELQERKGLPVAPARGPIGKPGRSTVEGSPRGQADERVQRRDDGLDASTVREQAEGRIQASRPAPNPRPARRPDGRRIRALSADEAAIELSERPVEAIRAALTGLDPAFVGEVLLALPTERAASVLGGLDGLAAGRLLDVIASRPADAVVIVRRLPADRTARALPYMTRARATNLMFALPTGNAACVLSGTDPRVVADVLTLLPFGTACRQLETMSISRACAVLSHVPPVTTAKLLRDCTDGRADRLLRGLSGATRTQVLRHMS